MYRYYQVYYQDLQIDSEMLTLLVALVPASTDERLAAESVLDCVRGCRILADKGFIGGQWQIDIFKTTGNQIFTPKRANQLQQQPKAFEGLLNSLRERIKGVFHEVQNTGRNLERLLRKKIDGICVHVAAKITSHTLRILLRQRFGIDVLTFEQYPIS
jgi:hypothetical protein